MRVEDAFKATAPGADDYIRSERRPSPQEVAARIKQLALMSVIEYEHVREAEAKSLGLRAAVLDKEVEALRPRRQAADDGDEGLASAPVEEVEPWPDPVNGLALAEDLRAALMAHVVFPSQADADAATLWVLGTYLMGVWRLWPKLLIGSPEKRCGKSTLLEVVEAHVCRGLLCANITPAALFRTIEKWRPTLLIDEADRFLRANEEANGIINAGHTRRTARVLRVVEVNGEHEPQTFSVWGAQAIAGIGGQADTLEDRSVRISLKRALPSERIAALPALYFEQRGDIRRKLTRWAADAARRIEADTTVPPCCGNARARDNWAPLFRIANALGGDWPDRVANAYAVKEAANQAQEDSVGVMLLRDIWEMFEQQGKDRLQSSDIVAALMDMEDRPWPEWKAGKPITANGVSRLLKPFGVKPKKHRFGAKALMGYTRSDMGDASARYLAAPTQTGTPEQSNEINDLRRSQTGTRTPNVPVCSEAKPLKTNTCSGVPVCGPPLSGDGADEGVSGTAWDPDMWR